MYKSKINSSIEARPSDVNPAGSCPSCALGCTNTCKNACENDCAYDCRSGVGWASLPEQNK